MIILFYIKLKITSGNRNNPGNHFPVLKNLQRALQACGGCPNASAACGDYVECRRAEVTNTYPETPIPRFLNLTRKARAKTAL